MIKSEFLPNVCLSVGADDVDLVRFYIVGQLS